jgi:hypothetical protein
MSEPQQAERSINPQLVRAMMSDAHRMCDNAAKDLTDVIDTLVAQINALQEEIAKLKAGQEKS